MLSKNNLRELLNRQRPCKQRFTIKKLTIGVASVLLGFTFMGYNASASTSQPVSNEGTAQASLTTNSQANNQPTQSGSDSSANNTVVLSVQKQANKAQSTSAASSASASQAASSEGETAQAASTANSQANSSQASKTAATKAQATSQQASSAVSAKSQATSQQTLKAANAQATSGQSSSTANAKSSSTTTTLNLSGLTNNKNADPSTLVTSLSEQTDSEKYQPEGKPFVTNPESGITMGDFGDGSAYINWPNGAPTDGTPTYAWQNPELDLGTVGIYTDNVNITYKDGSTSVVTIPVQVIAYSTDASRDYAAGKTITVPVGHTLSSQDAEDAIANATVDVPEDSAWKLPSGTTYDWYQTVDTATIGNHAGIVKVTYPDSSTQLVSVTVEVTNLDKVRYQPVYQKSTVYPYAILTASPTWSTSDGNSGTPTSATFSATSDTPSWMSVASNGTITFHYWEANAHAAGTLFDGEVPVKVTYGDGSSETVNVPVDVERASVQLTTRIIPYKTHKTSSGSASAPLSTPKLDEFKYENTTINGTLINSITYQLNADGTEYVATTPLTDQYGLPIKMANGSDAPKELASDIFTSVSYLSLPNTDVSDAHFAFGTGTDQLNPGSPMVEAEFTSSKEANELLGNSSYMALLHGTVYGAVTGSPLTFYQNTDISNLSQDQYRTLINVSDLGANGWGGTNINPSAPEVMLAAYMPGTDSTKTFYMTWAPNGQPSTATVKNGVAGTVRIHFNDGTWLDVPATINVIAKSTTPTDQTFTQKIVYTYNGQEVSTTSIDNIKNGGSLTATTLKNTIDDNVPSNYTIKSGYIYPSTESNITATPATIYVPLTINSDVNLNLTGKLVYKKADGTNFYTGVSEIDGTNIKSKKNDILPAALLKDYADQGMSSNAVLKYYTVAQYPASYQVENNNFEVTVLVQDRTEVVKPGDKPTVPTNDPKNPTKSVSTTDLNGTSTRTIKFTVPAGQTAILDQTQPLNYTRDKLIDAVTGDVVTGTHTVDGITFKAGYSDWNPTDGTTWKSVDVTNPNHTAEINYNDGQPSVESNTVKEVTNVPEGRDSIVNVTYKDITVPVTPGGTDPKNPTGKITNPNDPTYGKLFTTSTRKINITDPDGTKENPISQVITYGRTGVFDKATGQLVNDKYGKTYYVYDTKNNQLTTAKTGTWASMDVTKPNYDAYINYQDKKAVKSNLVSEKDNVGINDNEEVVVTYKDTIVPVTPGQKDPANPTKTVNPNGSDYKDFFTTSTRTIEIANPNGHIQTIKQVITYGRIGKYDKATGKYLNEYTPYYVYNTKTGQLTKETTGTWQVQPVGKKNYKTYVNYDNKRTVKSNKVMQVKKVPAGRNSTVKVTYKDVIVPVTPGGTDPKNPNGKITNPNDPTYKEMFTTSTRTITIINPDGTPKTIKQVITYGRTGEFDKATGQLVNGKYGDYYVYDTKNNQLTTAKTGTWASKDVTVPNYDAYISYQDKKAVKSNLVIEKDNVGANDNENVDVTYKDTIVPVTPGGTDPKNPNGKITNPNDPTYKEQGNVYDFNADHYHH